MFYIFGFPISAIVVYFGIVRPLARYADNHISPDSILGKAATVFNWILVIGFYLGLLIIGFAVFFMVTLD